MWLSWRDFAAPLLCIAVIAAAVVFHEAGHVAAAYLTGGSVASFHLLSLSPHVTISAAGSRFSEEARAIAGTGGVTSFIFIILFQYGWNFSLFTQTLGFFALVEFAGWVLSALFPDGSPNDAADLMASSGVSGLVVAAVALTLGLVGVLLITMNSRRRRRVDGISLRV